MDGILVRSWQIQSLVAQIQKIQPISGGFTDAARYRARYRDCKCLNNNSIKPGSTSSHYTANNCLGPRPWQVAVMPRDSHCPTAARSLCPQYDYAAVSSAKSATCARICELFSAPRRPQTMPPRPVHNPNATRISRTALAAEAAVAASAAARLSPESAPRAAPANATRLQPDVAAAVCAPAPAQVCFAGIPGSF